MTEKELFEIHQDILSELLSGRPVDEKLERKIRDFLMIANAKVDAFVQTIGALSYELKKFNSLADELCSMRDLIQNERTRRHAISTSEETSDET